MEEKVVMRGDKENLLGFASSPQLRTEMLRPIATIVGDILGSYYYNHQAIETLLYESGASGEVPVGNCASKITSWLIREGNQDLEKTIKILGKVLQEYMDEGINRFSSPSSREENIERINAVLKRYELRYAFGGKIFGVTLTAPSRTLGDKLRDLSIIEIEEEFDRAHRSVEFDPPSAVTAACAIIEALCKLYIEKNSLDLPSKQTIANLWKVVAKDLNLVPGSVLDEDLNRILSGLASIVDGIGAFRTHAGSAHGRSQNSFRIAPRHARLAVHSAHTVCLFVLETWQARKKRNT